MTVEERTPAEVELLVLSSFRTAEDVATASAWGLRDESWQVDEHLRVWEYMLSRSKNGEVATHADVEGAFGIRLVPEVTDTRRFVDDLVRLTVVRRASAVFDEYGNDTFRRNPKHAIEGMIGDLAEIIRTSDAHTSYFDKDFAQYVGTLTERAARVGRGELIGIPFGIPTLDRRGDSLKPGSVVAIMGPLNSGKSFWLLRICAGAYHYQRKRVLFLSPESTTNDINDRLIPMVGRFMGHDFSNSNLRNGVVDLEALQRYASDMALEGRSDWITRDSGELGSFSTTDIVQLAREHRPDIIAIDGVHLISGEGKTWENLQSSAKQLKGLAQSMGIVIIGGCQVQREAVTALDDTANLGHTAYGMAYVEACNLVLALGEKRGDPMQRIWRLIKNRDGEKLLAKQYLKFDVDHGDIGELGGLDIDLNSGLVTFGD